MAGHFLDSEVRSYSRAFPAVFGKARGSYLYDVNGRKYLDFFCGAGALNYGHNEPNMKRALLEYIGQDGVNQSLDMATCARNAFLDSFHHTILAPRGMDYRVQFTGPTGTNAVEAALKLARKVKKRSEIIAFTRAYHGLSLGALAVTANRFYRDQSFGARSNVTFFPFEGFAGGNLDTVDYLRRYLQDESSGLDHPAAIILETVQAEGGINVASVSWLRGIEQLCREFEMLLIVDDIQVGCGRTGTFFSFEEAGLRPDIVVISKSLSGYGFPMAINLIRPDIDRWKPGEHSGTFRGNGAALVTATAALQFWADPDFPERLAHKHLRLIAELRELQSKFPQLQLEVRGRGLILGLDSGSPQLNHSVAQECFARGLIIERCGGRRNILKLLPPLTISEHEISEAFAILAESMQVAVPDGVSA